MNFPWGKGGGYTIENVEREIESSYNSGTELCYLATTYMV